MYPPVTPSINVFALIFNPKSFHCKDTNAPFAMSLSSKDKSWNAQRLVGAGVGTGSFAVEHSHGIENVYATLLPTSSAAPQKDGTTGSSVVLKLVS